MPTAIENEYVQAAADVSAAAGDGLAAPIGSIGVPSTILIPPAKNRLTRATFVDYLNAGTAHTITFMVPMNDDTPKLTGDVMVNGTTLSLSSVPHDSGGNVPASGDWVAIRGVNGNLYRFHVASYSAGVITITATSGYGDANGTGVPVEFPSGRLVWFFGSPSADQPRKLVAAASARTTLPGILCTTPKVYQPIIVHSDNGTAAALSFYASGDNVKPE